MIEKGGAPRYVFLRGLAIAIYVVGIMAFAAAVLAGVLAFVPAQGFSPVIYIAATTVYLLLALALFTSAELLTLAINAAQDLRAIRLAGPLIPPESLRAKETPPAGAGGEREGGEISGPKPS